LSKYRRSKSKAQDKLVDFSTNPFPWPHMREGGSHRDCKLNNPNVVFCTSDFCHRHGQYQRIIDRQKVGSQPNDDWTCWAAVVQFGVDLPAPVAAKCKNTIRDALDWSMTNWHWLWRWEWKNWKLHLNMTILCSPNCGRSDIATHLHKPKFKLGLDDSTTYKTYCLRVRNWDKWHDYLFKTKSILAYHECPPKIDKQRWSYWGMSKGFPQSN